MTRGQKNVVSRHRRRIKWPMAFNPRKKAERFRSRQSKVKEIFGYRYSEEEDAILKDAVLRYIKGKQWEKREGLEKMMNRRKYVEAYNCWNEIKMHLPHRDPLSIRRRAVILFHTGSHQGHWTKQETKLLRLLYKKHGNQWTYISTLINRSRDAVKEKCRCMIRTKSTGVWTLKEMHQLSNLVHIFVRINMVEDSSSRQLLRDNVCWDKIADAIGTHGHASCCNKWYGTLSAGIVNDGLWATKDDFLLLERLLESGACSEEEVEWSSLLPYRSGQMCIFRWKQLANHLGEKYVIGFLEKLDRLVLRYAPELLFPDIIDLAKISNSLCNRRYKKRLPVLVSDELGASKDDFLLLERLLESGACTEEEVEWDNLLPHRAGQWCLFRWIQLAKRVRETQVRGFLKKLDSLVHRYAPELHYSQKKNCL